MTGSLEGDEGDEGEKGEAEKGWLWMMEMQAGAFHGAVIAIRCLLRGRLDAFVSINYAEGAA